MTLLSSWQKAREDDDVKLFNKDQEVYVLERSGKRVFKNVEFTGFSPGGEKGCGVPDPVFFDIIN